MSNPNPDNQEPRVAQSSASGASNQHHVSKILDDVLDEPPPPEKSTKALQPTIILDLFLALGLLFACFGFTVALFHMYLTHSALQAINQQNYKAAISILRGAPMPEIFSQPGTDTEDLLSKSLYLDAIDKIESGAIHSAVEELNLIRPGSKYFVLAQKTIDSNTVPAPILLEGSTERTERAAPANAPKSPLEKVVSGEN